VVEERLYTPYLLCLRRGTALGRLFPLRMVAHVKNSGVKLFAPGIHKEERRSVGVDEALRVRHHFDNQRIHAHHVLEN